jgi:histidinol dehydrogenase
MTTKSAHGPHAHAEALAPDQFQVLCADQIPAHRHEPLDEQTLATARAIVDDVRLHGEPALRSHAERLGDLDPVAALTLGPAQLQAALERLPRNQRSLLERTAARISSFAAAQRDCLTPLRVTLPDGAGVVGHDLLPVESAGCYAPGGRFPLPSSVLMTAITARIAGVQNVWVASPRPTEITLAAAAIAGADGLLTVGGAQAVAAFTHGIGGVPRCDMIVGPGNRWVTAAKQLVSGTVGIDMLAGPSELVILADASANPATIAADLLAQAEHDPDAAAILITTSESLARATRQEIARQLATLPTRSTAAESLRHGFAAIAADIDHAIDICNRLAPEHLQVMTNEASAVAARLQHCGALFIGPRTAEVLGDYGVGPNHVLPTGGTARFRAGLSVFTFLRVRTWMRIDDAAAAAPLARDAADLARLEGLEAHARAADLRTFR